MELKHLQSWIVAIVVIFGVSAITALPSLERLHGLDIDALHWLRENIAPAHSSPASSPTVIVAIDEQTYVTPPFIGLPKVMWTQQIGKVQSAVLGGGAAAFGWDIILPTSASTYVADRRFDQALLRSLLKSRKSRRVVLGSTQLNAAVIGPHRTFLFAAGGAKNLRSLNLNVDDDGIARGVPLTFNFAGKGGAIRRVPSMALELAARAKKQRPDYASGPGVKLGEDHIPGSPDNVLTLNFDGGAGAVPVFSFADLHQCAKAGNKDYFRQNFAGKVVLFGLVLDLEDRKISSNRLITRPDMAAQPTVCNTGYAAAAVGATARTAAPGVLLHATAVNNLLRGDGLDQFGAGARFLIGLPLMAIIAFLALLYRPPLAITATALFYAIWIGLATFAFRSAIVVPLLDPIVGSLITFFTLLGYRFMVVDKDKRYLRKAFSSYISPNLVKQIVEDPKALTLGGRRQECTFLFTDISGFTTMVEANHPDVLTPLLNEYIDGMIEIVFEHGGTLDKIVGDALVVMFSAPIEMADHAERGVRCAARMDAFADAYSEAQKAKGIAFGHTRVGVNTGMAVVGNFGGQNLFDYTALGDAINTAARLESVNKHLGTRICVSESTVAGCPNFTGRPVGALVLKGKTHAINVFEALSPIEAGSPGIAAYNEAFAMMEQSDPGALDLFTRLQTTQPEDPLVKFHLERLRRGDTGVTITMDEK